MSRIKLTRGETLARDRLVRAVEAMMLYMTPEEVGRIADHVGEHGTEGDGGAREDAAVVECLRVVVDAMERR